MTNAQISIQVKTATYVAIQSHVEYTVIGFTSFGLVIWAANGSCSIK